MGGGEGGGGRGGGGGEGEGEGEEGWRCRGGAGCDESAMMDL